jgi:hypothetical protein
MDMPRRVMGVQHQVVDFRPPEMEYTSLMVIDPYDSMIMIAHDHSHPASGSFPMTAVCAVTVFAQTARVNQHPTAGWPSPTASAASRIRSCYACQLGRSGEPSGTTVRR